LFGVGDTGQEFNFKIKNKLNEKERTKKKKSLKLRTPVVFRCIWYIQNRLI